MDVKPRKSPRQARAKATVDAIVEATTQVLLKEGYERFTTARAAERAGVSIGSLYQYFPNKAALACAVIDRCCEEFLAAFDAALAGRRRGTLEDGIRALVDATLVSHHLTPELHRMVHVLAPRLGVAEHAELVGRSATRMIETLLRKHENEISPEIDLARAAVVIEALLESLSHRGMHAGKAPEHKDSLTREATRMIVRYLGGQCL
ncbi:MAG: TetR/AcrR family transcriptional regulator [Burkholderiaceae bacterium]